MDNALAVVSNPDSTDDAIQESIAVRDRFKAAVDELERATASVRRLVRAAQGANN